MINFYGQDFSNKVVLEVGTGRGGTTIELAKFLSKFNGCKLITTDLNDDNFEKIEEEIKNYHVQVEFIKTDGCILEGIENNSIDFLVCNYTLCAINSKCGSEALAINRFNEVLKENGVLYIEEEYPIDIETNDMEYVWKRKWQLRRATSMLLGDSHFNEINPYILAKILKLQGFKDINWEKDSSKFLGDNCLEFSKYRLSKLLDKLENKDIVNGIKKEMEKLEEYAIRTNGMEVPIYKIIATKI